MKHPVYYHMFIFLKKLDIKHITFPISILSQKMGIEEVKIPKSEQNTDNLHKKP